MTASVPQEVLVQPTRTADEPTPEWRARYKAAHQALIEHLLGLEGVTDADSHEWASDPNVIVIRTATQNLAPAFQFDADGKPRELVQTVNYRLALRYRDGGGIPWASARMATIVWWLRIHPEFGVPPIDLLGTDRESELIELATDPSSLC